MHLRISKSTKKLGLNSLRVKYTIKKHCLLYGWKAIDQWNCFSLAKKGLQ
uniref:Uncharacterized protein n=1 Tax=Rhizophora mucronata TaxID=61149 RepID=A0A2P2Q126_RHIMU